MNPKKKNYRVFMVRIFRNTKYFEVKANSQKEAEKLAEKVANKTYNPYELLIKSTDNGFCEVDSFEIKKLGHHISDDTKPYKVKRIHDCEKGSVYIDARGEE